MIRRIADPRQLALGGLLVLGAAVGPAGGASAQGLPAEVQAPRFAFAPVEGGALKLDRETGRVSLCAKRPAGYTCEAVPDTRDAYEAEIARLAAELDTLRRQMAAGPSLPPVPPAPGTPPAPGAAPSPEASEFDRALDYAERVYRRLKGLIDEMRGPGGQERL
ncbi:hypothetical protein V5F49_01685 [Xanthobacter sp. V3C-3]|uniref:hypothetical protein n=1 Tax=Xanthobacter lutulentifluminis TaxID=3119935 RepID=UPI00372CC186